MAKPTDPIPADLAAEFAALSAQCAFAEELLPFLRSRLIGYFGDDQFDVFAAKDGLTSHSAEEVAMVTLVKLGPLFSALPSEEYDRIRVEAGLDRGLNRPGSTARHATVPNEIFDD